MADSMDDSSTIEEIEVNSEFEEVLEAFNEMHEEAQRLVLNKKLKSDLKLHITKLGSTQTELDKLKQENENLVSSYKAIGWVCISTSLNMDDYKSLQTEFENFKKDHYVERMKLQTEHITNPYLLPLMNTFLVGPNISRCNSSNGLEVETMFLLERKF